MSIQHALQWCLFLYMTKTLTSVYKPPRHHYCYTGTDLHEKAIARSNSYADKNSLPHYKYALHPRTTGFIHVIKNLRKYHGIDSIVDITVAYPSLKSPKKLEELVVGKFPQRVMFYIRVYKNDELPEDDDGLNKWCVDRWIEKEKRLTYLYEVSNKVTTPSSTSHTIERAQEAHFLE